jgi:hypothetical protein
MSELSFVFGALLWLLPLFAVLYVVSLLRSIAKGVGQIVRVLEGQRQHEQRGSGPQL